MNEAQLEQTALEWLADLGWTHVFGPDMAPDLPAPSGARQADGPMSERSGYDETILSGRLRHALARINPTVPPAALDDAVRRIIRSETPSLVENNRRFHRLLTDGVDVAYQQEGRQVLGDETLKTIAQELVQAVRRSVTIDWNLRQNARAQMRVIVKRILRRYGYPPDKQEQATQTVLEQAEVLCADWLEA